MRKSIFVTTFLAVILIGGLFLLRGKKQSDQIDLPYIKAVYSKPVTYDPAQMNDGASLIFSELIYEGLLRFTESYGVRGGIAKSWETSKDGKSLTFILDKNAKFHDGSRVMAIDVVAYLSRNVHQLFHQYQHSLLE